MRLGSIDLQDFEVPQSVRFGGRHRLNVHVLAGGRRIVERLGPDDTEIQFRGTFSGPAAESRARAFDNVRLSGEIVADLGFFQAPSYHKKLHCGLSQSLVDLISDQLRRCPSGPNRLCRERQHSCNPIRRPR
jgi:hypothetical protein